MAAGWRSLARVTFAWPRKTRDSGMPEVKLGIIPSYGGTQRLRRLIGVGHMLALVLGAREIDAETANRWGLVDIVTPRGEAEITALQLAQNIASYAPVALAAAKRAIRDGGDLTLSDSWRRNRRISSTARRRPTSPKGCKRSYRSARRSSVGCEVLLFPSLARDHPSRIRSVGHGRDFAF